MTHYDLIGVAKTATVEEIEIAYEQKAMENHPERHPNDPAAAKRYAEIVAAYAVLSSEARRAQYDRDLDRLESIEVVDVDFSLAELIDGCTNVVDFVDRSGDRRVANFSFAPGLREFAIVDTSESDIQVRVNLEDDDGFSVHGDDLHTYVTINDIQARLGVDVTIDLPTGEQSLEIDKDQQDGSESTYEGLGLPIRSVLKGDLIVGWKVVEAPTYDIEISLEELVNGFSRQFEVQDSDEDETRTIEVELEPGWRDGDEIEIASELCYVKLNVSPSLRWGVDGDDICVEFPISSGQAVYGRTISIGLPQGDEEIDVPVGTKHGETYTYEGLGMPSGEDSEQGDLQVTFVIEDATFGQRLCRIARDLGLPL